MAKKSVSQLVKSPEWQRVRKSLVGTWKKEPEKGVTKLRKFLGGRVSSASDDKLRIVHNYVTGSGFRSGNITHPKITRLREAIVRERKKRNVRS